MFLSGTRSALTESGDKAILVREAFKNYFDDFFRQGNISLPLSGFFCLKESGRNGAAPLPPLRKNPQVVFKGVPKKCTQTFCETKLQMLSPLDETELAAAWRRAAGPDGKVPVSLYFDSFVGNGSY